MEVSLHGPVASPPRRAGCEGQVPGHGLPARHRTYSVRLHWLLIHQARQLRREAVAGRGLGSVQPLMEDHWTYDRIGGQV